MSAENWLLFLLVATAAVLSPGPAMLGILGLAIQRGFAATAPVIAGNALGVALLMAASVLGLAALVAAVPHGLAALRWIGAAYLAWLGIRALRTPPAMAVPIHNAGPWHGLMMALCNPKAILFFGAVLPQFVDPASPLPPQFAVLVASFVTLELLATGGVALAAGALSPALRRPAAAGWIHRIGGAVMLAAAALLALAVPDVP